MILLISAVFPPEPVVTASLVYDLAKSLSENYTVNVLTPKPSRPHGFNFNKVPFEFDRFKHIIASSYTCPKSNFFGRLVESYSFGRYASKYIRRNRSEIQCLYFIVWPLFAEYFIARTARRYSIPTVTHIQDIYPESLMDKIPIFKKLTFNLLLPIITYAQKNSSKIITISPEMRNYLIKSRAIENSKVDLVYNWQNDDRFLSYRNSLTEKNILNNSFTFMFLGSLSKTAKVDFIIKTFGNIRLENSRLLIAGDGSEKTYLISLADNYKGSSIEFLDAPPEKVPQIQNEADVLILSLRKGAAQFAFPSKLIAYLFSGKPIIACVDENSDTAGVIKQAECGWIVPPENPEALTSTILEAISIQSKDLQIMGSKGLKYAMENFTKGNNLNKLQSIIINVMDPGFRLSEQNKVNPG